MHIRVGAMAIDQAGFGINFTDISRSFRRILRVRFFL